MIWKLDIQKQLSLSFTQFLKVYRKNNLWAENYNILWVYRFCRGKERNTGETGKGLTELLVLKSASEDVQASQKNYNK